MTITPINVGDQSTIHSTFTTDTGIYPLTGLTTSNMAMHYLNIDSGVVTVGTGTWTIIDATNGIADYAPSAADVATPGIFEIYPVLALLSGPKTFDAQLIQITNLG